MNHPHHEPRLHISRDALLHNARLIRRQLAPGTKICAVVKANAYGHGADIVVDTLCNFACDGIPTPAVDMLAAGSLGEAMALPESSLPVLVLRTVENVYIGPARAIIEQAIQSNRILTVGTGSAADDIARIAMSLHRRAMIHVMIDSGMTRCGCDIAHLPQLLERIESHSSLKLFSIGTHLATSDAADDDFVIEQAARFRNATSDFVAKSTRGPLRTVANSGGVFFYPQAHFDLVRPGISLYGIDPTCGPNMQRPLQPVAKWTAPIISILNAPAGATIGYGRTWKSPRDTRVGLVPVGYADGYLRCLGNRASMIVHGQAVPVVGRVSMDLTTIDLHDVPATQVGDEVTVMDNDPMSAASIYALAEIAETIPYELFTRIGPRVKRMAVQRVATESAENTEIKH
ncbi:MAG TPA: alanine racemase [Tepidisphaeraceae bacterium]|nr:alanine racemase [Tepidisphaeraceae bacterium]